MTERYLFRGIRWSDEGWVQGYYCGLDSAQPHVNGYILCGDSRYEVDPVTIGQSTGMKDKNDRLIFEGDIIQNAASRRGIYEVIWHKNMWCKSEKTVWPLENTSYVEVIGNIHDNPELLEEAE